MAKKTTKKAEEKTKAVEQAVEAAESVSSEPVEAPVTVAEDVQEKPKKCDKKVEEPVIKCTIEFQCTNTTIRSIVDSIMEVEGKENVQTLDVYIQPENSVAYYVVNGNAEGKSVSF